MKRLYPRHRIDIGPEELFFGLRGCVRRDDAREASAAIESRLGPAWIPTLSVRSGFDLLLTVLSLAPGSEVMMSALTIPDMARIVGAHGLVVVPVDIDPHTLSPTKVALEAAWSPRVKVLVVAQLLGGEADLDAAERFCEERGILLVNDNAQGYVGPGSLADLRGDVAFLSFGSIKTASCLGGGLVRVDDLEVRGRMQRLQETWPVQSSAAYAKKIGQYAALLALRDPVVYGAFERACEVFGSGLDAVVMGMTRGFPCATVGELLGRLRQRPSAALLRLLDHRLGTFDLGRLIRRADAGQVAIAESPVPILGSRQTGRTHWLFAAQVDEPERYVGPLRASGFDSARGTTSLCALQAHPERPHPVVAHRIMDRLLFLPMYPEIPGEERSRLLGVLGRVSAEIHPHFEPRKAARPRMSVSP